MSTAETRLPFLKRLTAITDGGGGELDRMNLLYSLEYFENYARMAEFLSWFTLALGLEADDVEIGEGFKSQEIHENVEPLEMHDADSHQFRNLIFSVSKYEPADLLAWAETRVSDFEMERYVQSLHLDAESGFFLLKLVPDGTERQEKIEIGYV
jgi:hypothetical protein